MSALAGQSAVITGGASGIGLGIAQALCRRGVRVMLADILLRRRIALRERIAYMLWVAAEEGD